ncbi:uncharacterized protein Z518_10963 [Rhinocladiella mackenziei CBS 650.93]|uniref:Prion-inhibition and propagation HeLo domain-containing protein n=1 Tax=Rhinocladiella mackenziei CBS 650.93 TaxID=1442369 RepID=A0A0D2I9X5_9EURO|nr:uncharacterized protein Z518_10963 [Rhinocladiella mackenziei CBS 650.93]KIX00036.1 hypothetical protein Z518_10963 [Rhinocladiella mackenziei CBS 650.93]
MDSVVIDFTSTTPATAEEIYHSTTGSTDADKTFQQVTKGLQRLSVSLESEIPPERLDASSQSLNDLTSECSVVADDLLELLKGLQAKDPSTKCQTMDLKTPQDHVDAIRYGECNIFWDRRHSPAAQSCQNFGVWKIDLDEVLTRKRSEKSSTSMQDRRQRSGAGPLLSGDLALGCRKSSEGLIRSLLYSILAEFPDLILKVPPKQGQRTEDMFHAISTISFDSIELENAFDVLMDASNTFGSHRLALFIDGPDEFEPEGMRYRDISSRDIHRLDIFSKNEDFQNLHVNQQQFQWLRKTIAEKCDGGFLWVALVLRNLAESWIAGDRLTDLQSTILTLSTKLEDLSANLLNSTKPPY